MSLVVVRRPAIPAFEPTFAPSSYIYQRLPASPAFSSASATVAAELARQAGFGNPALNFSNYTARLTEVPADQPLIPVKLYRANWPAIATDCPKLAAMLAGGLPIPEDFVAAPGTDHEACFYQPDYVHPLGYEGRYYEAWTLVRNTGADAEQYPWIAGWGGRVVGTDFWPGYYVDWLTDNPQAWWPYRGYWSSNPGQPRSTYQERGWGVCGSGLPLRDLEITINDLRRGRIDHMVGLAVPRSGWPHVWPAQRTDSNDPPNPIREGMRLCFPPGYTIPASLHPIARVIAEACLPGQGYGLVVWDQTSSVHAFRVEPSAEQAWAGTPTYNVLKGFPWADLRVVT
jgi:hypothetical protein